MTDYYNVFNNMLYATECLNTIGHGKAGSQSLNYYLCFTYLAVKAASSSKSNVFTSSSHTLSSGKLSKLATASLTLAENMHSNCRHTQNQCHKNTHKRC